MKTDKVKSVQANGTWDGKYGLMYKYEVSMENGDTGEYSSNKYTSITDDNFPFPEGKEVNYDFQDGQYPKIKTVSEFKPFKKSGGGNASFALSYAKDLVVADKVPVDKILETATKLNEWLNQN